MSRRAAFLVGAALAFCLAGRALAEPADFDSTRAVLGIGAGVLRLESAGTRARVHFDLALEARRWLELGAQLGFGYLEQPDPATVATEVHAEAVLRARWWRPGRTWAPFARAGGGLAWRARSGPSGAGSRDEDPLWSVGGGLDVLPRGRLVLRGELVVLGHGDRRHAAATLAALYALR